MSIVWMEIQIKLRNFKWVRHDLEKKWFTAIKIGFNDWKGESKFWDGDFKFEMLKLINLATLSISTGGSREIIISWWKKKILLKTSSNIIVAGKRRNIGFHRTEKGLGGIEFRLSVKKIKFDWEGQNVIQNLRRLRFFKNLNYYKIHCNLF